MFGHNKDDDQSDEQHSPVPANMVEPQDDVSLGEDNKSIGDNNGAIPGGPPLIGSADEVSDSPVLNPMPPPPAPAIPTSAPTLGSTADSTPAASDDLLGIKQQALQQLTPLVGHLEQTPEEKFRTTMMMIQAADNQELVKTAYEAAQQIGDEKTRAQALLDIVNEINYFTQQKK